MQVSKLCEGAEIIKYIRVDKEKEILNITNDYKNADKDSIFFAIKGEKQNGNQFANKVIQNGGIVVSDDKMYAHNLLISGGRNFILTENARKAMSQLSANFFENPQEKLEIIAVVGTNGKTSTACIIRDIFEYSGIRTGIIGTLETRFEDVIFQSEMTTPDPIKLFEILKTMWQAGCRVVVMEWSAHAIALEKLANLTAEIAIFTNFSQDHLDFFGDMQKYKEVKKSIFVKEHVKTAVVNADDAVGREIIANACVPILSYGIESVSDVFCISSDEMQKYTNKILDQNNENTKSSNGKIFLNYLDEICEINSRLKGRFNTYNLLGGITASRYFGLDFKTISGATENITGVQGRYQSVSNNLGVEIIVDYAHTPDGMENILGEMRKSITNANCNNVTNSKLICVFGCGGNRDSSKRVLMGEVSEKYSDVIVITSDNPRFENPEQIMEDILLGIQNKEKAILIQSREDAIKYAISIANHGDKIAILGKGHEEYIDEGGEKRYYSDTKAVENAINT